MDILPRTPVIVGVGQITRHPSENASYESRPTPLDLMVDALSLAASDAGNERLVLESLVELIAIGSFTWHPNNPALLVSEKLAITPLTKLTPTGGNLPQKLVHELSKRILAGELDSVGVVGAEAMYAHALARKEGRKVDWPQNADGVEKLEPIEEERIPFTADEYNQGLTLPIEVYPLFENARRARLGWSLSTQREKLGQLWANFAGVAATNPHAWIQTSPSAQDIAQPSTSNRMVSFPYTKMLVANLPVDMGAGYIMMSYERASALGVPREKMVFPQAGADATDHWFISERLELDSSPAMEEIWRALQDFGVTSDELEHFDLYSCFPTVVQTAADVLGIDAFSSSRVPTLTGGLTFGGGPGNNYVTHSICAMVEKLRANPSDRGLVTGLGWFSTKHAWGTYATTPPVGGFQHRDVQERVDARAKCTYAQFDGEVTVETYTVAHGRSGEPTKLVIATRNDSGVRTWCHSVEPELLAFAETSELIGQRGRVVDGVFAL